MRWMAVACAADAPNASTLFFSLLNTVLGYDPVGMGIPYGGVVGTSVPRDLMELSSQVLVVLLDYGRQGSPISTKLNTDAKTGYPLADLDGDAKDPGYNVFRTLLARMSGDYELTFCFKGFARLLNNVHEANNTYLPGSVNGIGNFQEILILLWKFLEECPHFLKHLLSTSNKCDVNDLVVSICYLMFEARSDTSRSGLVHICTFLLLKLSGERAFGVAANNPFRRHLPIQLPLFHGGHNDLIVVTLHKMVTDSHKGLVPLHTCHLTIIANISPYFKSLSIVGSVKLVQLFEFFSSNRMLFGRDRDLVRGYLGLLLETFNNVVQYQWTNNQQLVYAVLRKRAVFKRVLDITLEDAVVGWKKAGGGKSRGGKGATTSTAAAAASSASPKKETAVAAAEGGEKEGSKEDEEDEEGAEGAAGEEEEDSDDRKPAAKPMAGLSAATHHSLPTTHATSTSSTPGGTPRSPWTPTAGWIASMHRELPSETLRRLFDHLVPDLDAFMKDHDGSVDEQEILAHIAAMTVVGLLPVPHPLVIRRYMPNAFTDSWFTAFLWGVVFLRNQRVPIFDGESIKLFNVNVR